MIELIGEYKYNVAREFRQITPVDFLDQWRSEGSEGCLL